MPYVPTLGLFFPQVSPCATLFDLSLQPTTLVTPNASEVVWVITPSTWAIYTLTAGVHVADGTHVLPLDYDASTNAKTWVLLSSGTFDSTNQLIDSSGNPLVDSSGNGIYFG